MEVGQTVIRKTHTDAKKHEVKLTQYRHNEQIKHCSCGAITVIKYRNLK